MSAPKHVGENCLLLPQQPLAPLFRSIPGWLATPVAGVLGTAQGGPVPHGPPVVTLRPVRGGRHSPGCGGQGGQALHHMQAPC